MNMELLLKQMSIHADDNNYNWNQYLDIQIIITTINANIASVMML